MRKFALFVVLFGAGFGLLWVMRTKPSGDDAPSRTAAEPEAGKPAAGQEGPFTNVVPDKGDKGKSQGPVGIRFDGPVSFQQLKTLVGTSERRREFDLRSKDVDALEGDAYDVRELEVELYDPPTQRKRAELRAPLARVHIAVGADGPRLSDSEPVRLTNVDLTLFEGGPIVPVRVRVPSLDWNLKDTSFASNERVSVTGKGVRAEGTGLDASTLDSRFELRRDAWIDLTLENGQTGRLSSDSEGGIVVQRVVDGTEERIDLVASHGARFRVERVPGVPIQPVGAPMSIDADRIHMIGRKVGATGAYEIVAADAKGHVVSKGGADELRADGAVFTFAPGGRVSRATLDREVTLVNATDTFAADHAEFEFDERGDLSRATLTGTPSGRVEVGRFLVASRPELAGERAELTGKGPLVVTRGNGDRIDFTGPARLEVPGQSFVMTASERILGRDDETTQSGEMTAVGAVALDYGANHMTSDGLNLAWSTREGKPRVVASTTGVTTLQAKDPNGRTAATVARGGMTASIANDKLVVEEAFDVDMTSPEEGGLHARAAVVRNLDPESRRFEAEGGVTFDSSRGSGTADRVVAKSRDEVRLYGTITKPADYDFAKDVGDPSRGIRANVKAREIVALADHVLAEGDVKGFVETPDGRLDVQGGLLDLTIAPEDRANPAAPRAFRAHASHAVKAAVRRATDRADVSGDDLVFEGTLTKPERDGVRQAVTTSRVDANGNVHVDYAGDGHLIGDGDHFTLDEKGTGRLSADEGRRVRARGRFAGTVLPYTVEADWVEFDPDHVEASQVRMRLDAEPQAKNVSVEGAGADRDSTARAEEAAYRPEVAGPVDASSPRQDGPGGAPALLQEFRAQRIRADRHEFLMTGAAHVQGVTRQGEPWTVDAETIRMRGDFSQSKKLETKNIASIDAEGGFSAVLGDRLSASGDLMHAVPGNIRVEGKPAHLVMLDADWQSTTIEYDTKNMLLATDRGALRARVGSPGPSWSVDYESMQPFDQGEDTILVLRNPRVRFGSKQMSAEWMLFWVDRDRWRSSGLDAMTRTMAGPELRVTTPGETAPTPTAPGVKSPFQVPDVLSNVGANPIFKVLSEVYVEGNIEMFDQGERNARASAIYLNIVDQQGWIQDVDVIVDVSLRGFERQLRAKAGWMRISPGPALQASNAEITSCEFDQPHYVIETSDLRMTPKRNSEDQRVAFDVAARGNSLRFENGMRLPLPPLVYETDDEGNPLIDRFVLGNSAKYGAAVRATVNAELGPIGRAAGQAIAGVLRIPDVDVRGNWKYNIGILGSRGVLLGMGLDLRISDRFKMLAEIDGIPDRRSDRGLVRVDEDDRSLLRTWFRAKARYTIRDGEWVDVALSDQSDPGVQSEFFERDYLRYERKDNYIHWRKARNEWYLNASAKIRVDDRRDVDELPSGGAFLGRTQITEVFEHPVYYTGRADFGILRRRDGDARYYRPFEDGLGDRDVDRFDTEHSLESPFDLGVLAARGTPYLKARGTAWSEGADPDAAPHRMALIAGFDATTTFWRRFAGGSIHTITPTVGVREDVLSEESGGELVRIDATEDPIDGRFVDFGVRSRWWKPDTLEKFDVEVRASHGSALPTGQRSGLQPLAVLSEFLTYYGDVPVGLTHDGRYDTHSGNTTYSLTSLGFEPWDNVGVELGYQRGLATVGQARLFESASIAARWRWTTKWEMEVGQSYAIADDTGVGNNFVLRRQGHDFVTEFEVSFRSGEGSTFSIGFQPRISWKRSGLGLLDRWLGVYH